MKFTTALSFILSLATAAPVALESRQTGITSNDLETGTDCPGAILIFARGSTEPGNMGITTGPVLANALNPKVSGGLWVQGVGGPYIADLIANTLPKGTTQEAIDEGARLLALANTKCANTPVVVGGYSQGSALMAAAISESPEAVQDQVKGVVFFGYTRNAQNNGGIPGFPQDRIQVYCAEGDLVCDGTLIVTPAHLTYLDEASNEAPTFLAAQIAS